MSGQPTDDSLFFIGNATVLLRFAGLSLLTDPNFVRRGESVPLGYGLSTERLTDPALEIDELPPLDAVILSHYHGDHFDRVAEEQLDRRLPIVTTPQAAEQLDDIGFERAVGLGMWQTHELSGAEGALRVMALPARHAPSGLSVALPDVMGSCLEFWTSPGPPAGDPALRLYITGDTIMFEGIEEIGLRLPPLDLALIHLGGTRVMGVTVTLDAEHGVELLGAVRPDLAVPIHYNDYDAFKSPLEDFAAVVRQAGLADRVRYLRHGEALSLSPRTRQPA